MNTAEFECLDTFLEDLSNKIRFKYGLDCRTWKWQHTSDIALYIFTDTITFRIFTKQDTEFLITYWKFNRLNTNRDFEDFSKNLDVSYMNLEKLERKICHVAKSIKDLLDNYDVFKKQKNITMKLNSIEQDFE